MKLTDFGIIFFCIFICFSTVWGLKASQISSYAYLQLRYNQAVDNAVTDALHMFVELDDGNEISYNIEEAKKQFFTTLGINLNMDSELSRFKLEEYVPVLCFILPEGFYIYHNTYIQERKNKPVREYVQSEFFNYYYEDQYYEYNFTLGDEIWIKEKETGNVYQGIYNEISRYCDAPVLKNAVSFNEIKKSKVVEAIRDKINYYANESNLHTSEFGLKYEINLPQIEDSLWIRTIENPGVLAVISAMPYENGFGTYSKVAFGGSRLYKEGFS